MLQKWYQYKEKNRFNKERIDLRLRRFFSPTLKFTNSTPHPKSFWRISKRHLAKTFPLALIFVGAFTVAFISSKQEAPTNPTNALADNNYTLSLSVDNPNLDLVAETVPGEGTFVITHHNVTVNTNAPHGAVVSTSSISNSSDLEGLSPSVEDNVNVIYSVGSDYGNNVSVLDEGTGENLFGLAVPAETSDYNANEGFSNLADYQNGDVTAGFRGIGYTLYKGGSKTFPVYFGASVYDNIAEATYSGTFYYNAYVLGSTVANDNIEITPNAIINPDGQTINVKTTQTA